MFYEAVVLGLSTTTGSRPRNHFLLRKKIKISFFMYIKWTNFENFRLSFTLVKRERSFGKPTKLIHFLTKTLENQTLKVIL